MTTLMTQKTNHSQKISKAIDKVLRQVFGDEAVLLIYKYLESHYSISQDEILEKIEIFSMALREFLKSGAYVVEMKILEKLYSNYGITSESLYEGVVKQDFVSQVKMLCLSKKENYG